MIGIERIRSALRIGLPLALLPAVLACGRDPTAPIDRDTFIEVMSDLRVAARDYTDPSAFDAQKTRILEAASVTDSALLAFVRAHQRDPEFMAAVWASIDERVNPPALEADTVAR